MQIGSSLDRLDQQYISPEKAFLANKTDIVIVGRGIYQAQDPREQAKFIPAMLLGIFLSIVDLIKATVLPQNLHF